MILIGASLSEPCIDGTVNTITLHFCEYRKLGVGMDSSMKME